MRVQVIGHCLQYYLQMRTIFQSGSVAKKCQWAAVLQRWSREHTQWWLVLISTVISGFWGLCLHTHWGSAPEPRWGTSIHQTHFGAPLAKRWLYIVSVWSPWNCTLVQCRSYCAQSGWSKKRRDDGTDNGTPGGQYATGQCPAIVYVRRTHDGTLARGVVQATEQTMRRHV